MIICQADKLDAQLSVALQRTPKNRPDCDPRSSQSYLPSNFAKQKYQRPVTPATNNALFPKFLRQLKLHVAWN